jgi:hypothetical protein
MLPKIVENRRDVEAKLIGMALSDPGFRHALIANPRSTIGAALGTAVPPNLKIQVVDEPPDTFCLVVPAGLVSDSELSDAELDVVSGGKLSGIRKVFGTMWAWMDGGGGWNDGGGPNCSGGARG